MENKKSRCNVYLDSELWHQFRVACLQNYTRPSSEFEDCMRARLKQWEQKGGKQKK